MCPVYSCICLWSLASMDLKPHGPTVNITDIAHYLLICCLPLKNGHRRLTKGPILVLLYHSAIHQVQACIHIHVLPQLCPPHATHVLPMSCLCPVAPTCVRAHVVPLSLPMSCHCPCPCHATVPACVHVCVLLQLHPQCTSCRLCPSPV